MNETPSDVARQNWPVGKDGFRIRGREMTRTDTFTDAAFAFAVTLLVISVDAIPSDFAELRAALGGIPAFAASFLLIGLFWYDHCSGAGGSVSRTCPPSSSASRSSSSF